MRTFGTSLRSWTKHDASPVTEADMAVNTFLHERLRALAPDYAWLSEETEDDRARLSAPRLWVVDPIDGTRSYMEGRTDWSISIALVDGGRPVVAALFAPAEECLFLAATGGGVTIDGAPMRLESHEGLARLRIAGPKRSLERLAALLPDMQPQPKVYSLALRLARVASGDLDAALASAASRDWDLAAADLLVHEAGGALTALDGHVPLYNRDDPVHRPLLASGAGRHARLIELLQARGTALASW